MIHTIRDHATNPLLALPLPLARRPWLHHVCRRGRQLTVGSGCEHADMVALPPGWATGSAM
jgi:hypothetical protein